MTVEENGEGRSPAQDVSASFELSLRGQLRIMANAFWQSEVRGRVVMQCVALLAIILLTAYAQIVLNEWNVPFYNAIERRDVAEFLRQLQIFLVIAGSLLLLNVCQTWLNQMAALSMREGLTNDLVNEWLKGRRALKLTTSGVIGVNPDQRLHEDARNLSELTTSLSIGLVQSSIILASFIGVLWNLSTDFAITLGDQRIAIPGYMVWASFLYAAIASLLSRVVGRRLVGLNAERYSREAELRFLLMRTSENLAPINLARGEERERRRILRGVRSVLSVIRQLATAHTNLTWVSAGFGWLSQVAPIIIAAPVYFTGGLTFGGLMMAVGAFNQVNLALRWYVINFGQIADWRAMLGRVSTFRHALQEMDAKKVSGMTIDYARREDETISFDGLVMCLKAGAEHFETGVRMQEQGVVIARGERVMINGDPGSNRHLLFNAMAGHWPWGKGEIGLPQADTVMFMSPNGYIANAALQEVLTYPLSPELFSKEELVSALERAGLARLKPILDTTARWDKVLDFDDQMKLRFANCLLQKPDFIVFDDVLEGLEAETQVRLAGVVEDLADCGLIYIGRSQVFLETFAPRVLHLEQVRHAGV